MPEEGLETHELRETLEEHVERAHEAKKSAATGAAGGHADPKDEHHKHPSWITPLSLSTALIAVMAAIASLESGVYSDEAILQKNDAVHAQAEEDDEWAWFQAKSTREALYASQAKIAAAVKDDETAKSFAAMAEGEGKEKQERQKGAEEKHKKVLENDAESQDSVERHHHFARSVTVFQVAIALSAIAALTKRKAVWWVSLAVGAVGVFFLTQGFLPAH